jgi:hypothetical protein
MREIVGMCRHIWDQLIRGSVVAAKEHGAGSWNVGVDIIAKLQVPDVACYEPDYDKEAKSNIARSFVAEVAEVAEDFCNLQTISTR